MAEEEVFAMPTFGEENHSLLKKCLSEDIFNDLKDKKSASGFTLEQAIQSGLDHQDSGIGVYAGDTDSYTTFAPLFDAIVQEYHGHSPGDKHISNFNADELKAPEANDDFVVSTRIRVGRNLEAFPLGPAVTKEQRDAIETQVSGALKTLEGDLKGTYYPIKGMSQEDSMQLTEDHFLFKSGDRFLQSAGLNRDWPDGRGIFHNDAKTFLVWVNEEDQLRIISMQKGGNIKEVFARLATAVKEIDAKCKFSFNEHLGYITSCPTNLGTAMRASVHIKLPLLSKDMNAFKAITDKHHLQIRGIHGEHSEDDSGIFDVSNKRRLGFTEVDLVQGMYDGVQELIAAEKALQEDEKEEDDAAVAVNDATAAGVAVEAAEEAGNAEEEEEVEEPQEDEEKEVQKDDGGSDVIQDEKECSDVAADLGSAAQTAPDEPVLDRTIGGTVIVVCHRAKDLLNSQFFGIGKQDPFVQIQAGKAKRRSQVRENGGQAPTWDDEYVYCPIEQESKGKDVFEIVVQVLNKKIIGSLDIGFAAIPLESIPLVGSGDETKKWYPLVSSEGSSGEVELTVSYVPPLHVVAHVGRGIKKVNLVGKMDLFLRATMNEVHRESDPADDQHQDPNWNKQVLPFEWPFIHVDEDNERSLEEQKLVLRVVDDNVLKDKEVGSVTISLGDLRTAGAKETWLKISRPLKEGGTEEVGEIAISSRNWQFAEYAGRGNRVSPPLAAAVPGEEEKAAAAAEAEQKKSLETGKSIAAKKAADLKRKRSAGEHHTIPVHGKAKGPAKSIKSSEELARSIGGPAEQGNGCVVVICHEAAGLHDTQRLGKQDPYILAKIGKVKKKGPVHEDGQDEAKWHNHELFFDLTVYKRRPKEVVVTVMNDNIIKDAEIGSCSIALKDVKPIKEAERTWIRLTRRSGTGGFVCVTVGYLPPLQIYAVGARGLAKSQMFGTQSPYCKLVLGKRSHTGPVHDGGGNSASWDKDCWAVNVPPIKVRKGQRLDEVSLDVFVFNKNMLVDKRIGDCRIMLHDLYRVSNGPDTPSYHQLYSGRMRKEAGEVAIATNWYNSSPTYIGEIDLEKWRKSNILLWYSAMKDFTFPTVFVALNAEQARAFVSTHYRRAEWQNVKIAGMEDGKYAHETKEEQAVVASLTQKIDAAIKKVGENGVLVKTTGSSAKDVCIHNARMREIYQAKTEKLEAAGKDNDENERAIALHTASREAMKCTTGEQAMALLLQSERVAEDLMIGLKRYRMDVAAMKVKIALQEKKLKAYNKALKKQTDLEAKLDEEANAVKAKARKVSKVGGPPVVPKLEDVRFGAHLAVRQWQNFGAGTEFRVFVSSRKPTAITQVFDVCHFPEVVANKQQIEERITSFLQSVQERLSKVKLYTYMIDLAVTDDGVRIIEIYPFTDDSSACLFSWKKDRKVLNEGPLECRVRTEVCDDFYGNVRHQWRQYFEKKEDIEVKEEEAEEKTKEE